VTASTKERIDEALPRLFQDSILCAGHRYLPHGSCKGDSGGPLMTKRRTTGCKLFCKMSFIWQAIASAGCLKEAFKYFFLWCCLCHVVYVNNNYCCVYVHTHQLNNAIYQDIATIFLGGLKFWNGNVQMEKRVFKIIYNKIEKWKEIKKPLNQLRLWQLSQLIV
jgi:hypothetical protein